MHRRQALRSLAGLGMGRSMGGLVFGLAGALVGCAGPGEGGHGAAATPPGDDPLLTRGRSVAGGFLAPPQVGTGLPVRPGTGMFVKLIAPQAVALRGNDLLVLDAGSGRLWRIDLVFNTLSAIAGAPARHDTALALGPDGSAWVLDTDNRQVLRFARDGRLLQNQRIAVQVATPVALALADGGLTVLLADGQAAQWSEQRGVGGQVQRLSPAVAGGQRVVSVHDLAVQAAHGPQAETVWLLDRLGGAVHQVRRDGQWLQTLGVGDLQQPAALAVDGFNRAFVVDQAGRQLVCLQAGQPARRLPAADLGVQQIGGLAIDERQLVLSDRLAGQVVMHRLGRTLAR